MTNPNLEAALEYASRGWRVIPIPAGLRFPQGFSEWQKDATTSLPQIQKWWGQDYPGYGVGIVTGVQSNLFVVDVDVKEGKQGAESVAALEATFGPFPDTYEVITGSGGRHLYFTMPAGQVITNANTALRAQWPDIDIRGEGGFVVAPPSSNNYGSYEVEVASPDHPAEAPQWLLGLLAEPEPQRPPMPSPQALLSDPGGSGERPGERLAASVPWGQLLQADGWTYSHTTGEEEHWSRPGKTPREGTSATVNYKNSDLLKVFTPSVPGLVQDKTYSRLGYLAAVKFQGDHSQAARHVRELLDGPKLPELADLIHPDMPKPPVAVEQWGVDSPLFVDQTAGPDEWPLVDWTAIADGSYEAPKPTILATLKGLPLFYEGMVNTVFGEPGSCKSWTAQFSVVETVKAGRDVLLIDHEDTDRGTWARLIELGLEPSEITARVLYTDMDSMVWNDKGRAALLRLFAVRNVALVVIDSTGEAMSAARVKANDDGEVARWFSEYPTFIAKAGPCVLLVDHMAKDSQNRNDRFSIGSQRKLAAVSGAAYRVDMLKQPSKTDDGLFNLVTTKDRHGNHTQGEVAVTLSMTHPDLTTGRLLMAPQATKPESKDKKGNKRPTVLMEKISQSLEDHLEGLSGAELKARVGGRNADRERALALLIDESHIEKVIQGRRHLHKILIPYRQGKDIELFPDSHLQELLEKEGK